MDEGPIIKFLYTEQTSNLKHKISDHASITAFVLFAYLIIRQEFKRFIFVFIYVALLLNILRHINLHYYSWYLETRTILPTILFIAISLTSILTMKNKKTDT